MNNESCIDSGRSECTRAPDSSVISVKELNYFWHSAFATQLLYHYWFGPLV